MDKNLVRTLILIVSFVSDVSLAFFGLIPIIGWFSGPVRSIFAAIIITLLVLWLKQTSRGKKNKSTGKYENEEYKVMGNTLFQHATRPIRYILVFILEMLPFIGAFTFPITVFIIIPALIDLEKRDRKKKRFA